MELSIKMNNFDLTIADNNIELSKVVNMSDICAAMIFLQSQIDILRCYKKGMKMGRVNMREYINDDGYYLGHNGFTASDIDSDI